MLGLGRRLQQPDNPGGRGGVASAGQRLRPFPVPGAAPGLAGPWESGAAAQPGVRGRKGPTMGLGAGPRRAPQGPAVPAAPAAPGRLSAARPARRWATLGSVRRA